MLARPVRSPQEAVIRHACSVKLAALALGAFVSLGCDPDIRDLKPDERQRLGAPLAPLLSAAYGPGAANCRITASVLDSDAFFATMVTGSDAGCQVGVLMTTGALNGLTPRALQTLLAHELGHLQSKHATGSGRATTIRGGRTDTGRQSVLHASREQFSPDEEAEADRAAANLMVVVWRGNNVGCLATADLFEDIAKDRSRWGRWLSRHPFPERRVEAVVKACEEALARPPR